MEIVNDTLSTTTPLHQPELAVGWLGRAVVMRNIDTK
jgi:hypothetical protein